MNKSNPQRKPTKISSKNKSKRLADTKAQGSSQEPKNLTYTYNGKTFNLNSKDVQNHIKKNKAKQQERRASIKAKQDSLREARKK
jgi:hypothetical protein